ncbi:uncharacterized protein LOC123625989 [Lemur catta]|uniref:uncharacterized protein LOC123625989 n=1 Tax=Lemur catta TaxID=9447 RepID=UPI001E2692B7|nr:uncharacterized protein LOC123625989 [Lemur catta]
MYPEIMHAEIGSLVAISVTTTNSLIRSSSGESPWKAQTVQEQLLDRDVDTGQLQGVWGGRLSLARALNAAEPSDEVSGLAELRAPLSRTSRRTCAECDVCTRLLVKHLSSRINSRRHVVVTFGLQWDKWPLVPTSVTGSEQGVARMRGAGRGHEPGSSSRLPPPRNWQPRFPPPPRGQDQLNIWISAKAKTSPELSPVHAHQTSACRSSARQYITATCSSGRIWKKGVDGSAASVTSGAPNFA